VDIDRHIGGTLDGLEDIDAKCQILGEMSVHHVEMDEIGLGNLVELAFEVGHICR